MPQDWPRGRASHGFDSHGLNSLEPEYQQPVQRLYASQQRLRWRGLLLLWLVVMPLSLWGLRRPLGLLAEYFTWSTLRYGLIYQRWSALGIFVTLILTSTSLLQHWRIRYWGHSGQELRSLKRQVQKIQAQGEKHPLWQRVWGK